MPSTRTDYGELLERLDWKAVHIASFTPGRVRLRSEQLRDNEALAVQLRSALSKMEALQQVEVRPMTGSVLIHYDPAAVGDPAALVDRAAALGVLPDGLDAERLKAMAARRANGEAPSTFSLALDRFFSGLNRSVERALGGAIDLKGLVPLALTGMGLRSVIRGRATEPIPWYNYFWFALTFYLSVHTVASDGNQPSDRPAEDEPSASS